MRNKSNSQSRGTTVDDIINKIKGKSADGNYIYRGEPEKYPKVSSSLYRAYAKVINVDEFDLIHAEKEMLQVARNHIGESPVGPLEDFLDIANMNKRRVGYSKVSQTRTDGDLTLETIGETIAETAEREILTELQHYGGKTNLIDFTTDYFIALFFACSGSPKEVGRVILLEKDEEIENMIVRPRNPRHRVIAQKSVFLRPPRGYVEISGSHIVYIPADLKQPLLEYLRKFHDVSAESIYNDIYGFIIYQNIHQSAYVQFYTGLTFHDRADTAESLEEKQVEYEKAIGHYTEAINLNPALSEAYCNRGEIWLHLQEWEKARADLTMARDKMIDIVASFRNDYENGVKEFEEETGFALPPDLAELLGEVVGDTSPDESWTVERFNELLSSQKYRDFYKSRNQTERLCEFGADLMALVHNKRWELTYKFNKRYFALYFRHGGTSRRVFGISLQGRPKLAVWLREDILKERNSDLYDGKYMHESYYESHGCGVYPEHVAVTDIEELLEFAYSSYADLSE